MPTLLQINSVAYTGSTGRIAGDLGLLARRQGWESHIAFGRSGGPGGPNTFRIGNDADIMIHGLQTRIFDRHGLGSGSATRKFIRKIREIRPDVIHLHNLHGYYLHIGVLFRYLAETGVPVVWTLHDCWPFTGHCAYFDAAGCEKWKSLCQRCPEKGSYPASLFADRSTKNFRLKQQLFNSVRNLTLVPVSRWMDGLAGGSFLGNHPRQIIYNGIDTEAFHPSDPAEVKAKYGLEGKFVVLGVSAGWSPRKGLDDLIRLAGRFSSDTRLLIVGLDREQMKRLPGGITGIMHTGSIRELAALYSSADVFVNPTHEDNFPTTNLESLACGTPVITYRTGGSAEAVTAETGLVVSCGDVSGLAGAVDRVRANGKPHYSSRCRDRAIAHYRRFDRYAEYLALYERLLA